MEGATEMTVTIIDQPGDDDTDSDVEQTADLVEDIEDDVDDAENAARDAADAATTAAGQIEAMKLAVDEYARLTTGQYESVITGIRILGEGIDALTVKLDEVLERLDRIEAIEPPEPITIMPDREPEPTGWLNKPLFRKG